MSASLRKPNRLIDEISPYLLQHAYNPVDWFPWCDAAFEKALREDKPVFLSIGYSTCHWCHVMESESFEDPETAEFLNDSFIAVKVDREERPDLDNIYMTACQIMNGSGGWPLSIFMTPEKKPFFAGTYFPKKSRYGRIGFNELLISINDAWKSNRSSIITGAKEFTLHIGDLYSSSSGAQLSPRILDEAYSAFEKQFDPVNGGFGNAPKFPSPHNLMFLLRYRKKTGIDKALQMAVKTLTEMRQGGIFDQIGFGFHRYSTDSNWFAPHFEKMLYDQSLLMMAYTEAYQITGTDLFKRTVKEISAYLLRDMISPEGAFYSAEDADSEGSEGKFYLWDEDELISLLGRDNAEFACRIFNSSKNGNFTGPDNNSAGANILHRKTIMQDTVYDESRLEKIRMRLFEMREKRIHPRKDDKVLTDWNGLIIAALAKAGRVFGSREYIAAAERALQFVLEHLYAPDGKLLHRFRDGKAGLTGSLDDYSFIIWSLLELYESTFKVEYIERAVKLTRYCIEHFWDKEEGGFFFTPDYGERLIVRTKEFYDGAVPSGNSVSALNLLRLSRITAESGYSDYAEKIFSFASRAISQNPQAYSQMLQAMDYSFGPSYEIIIAGDIKGEKTKEIIGKISAEFIPNKIVILKDAKDRNFNPAFKYLESYSEINEAPALYLCRNYECSLPVTEADELLKSMR